LLHTVVQKDIRGIIVDKWNQLELTRPGTYTVSKSEYYPHISFIPFTKHVKNVSLTGFHYPLIEHDVFWGSTLCISNKFASETGTFSYTDGMLLIIKSRDTT